MRWSTSRLPRLLPLVSVFLMNLATTETVAVSTGNQAQVPDDQSSRGVISGDGRYLAFFSRATSLLDTPQTPNVYVKDRWTGELRNVSATLGELRQFDRPGISISADGSVVSFSWRYADSVPTLGGRTLIYSVAIRGAPAYVPPVPVPTSNLWILLVMTIAVGVAGVVSRTERGSRRD